MTCSSISGTECVSGVAASAAISAGITLSVTPLQALSRPRVGPGGDVGGGGSGSGDSEITPYHLHQVVTTLAPDSPEVQRAASLAAVTSTPGSLAAASMASSLRHQASVVDLGYPVLR